MLITFEGCEGSGKTTQLNFLLKALEDRQQRVIGTREPGGTSIGEAIRNILLSFRDLSPRAEVMLFNAARAQLIDQVIRPALKSGKTVICDRFADSTLAYQGYGRKQPLYPLRMINAYATQTILPDLTFYLDVDPAVGLARKSADSLNRLDQESLEFHERVRQGFKELASLEPWRWVVLDGTLDMNTLHVEILERVLRDQIEPAPTTLVT